MRGYCGIGIAGGKSPDNLGTLWRTAHNMGAAFIFTIGARYPRRQPSDTTDAMRHLPLFHYDGAEDFALPSGATLVAVEQHVLAMRLGAYTHPERAVYVLGAEDSGVPDWLLNTAAKIVEIPSKQCLNVAVAGSIVLYDRAMKGPQ